MIKYVLTVLIACSINLLQAQNEAINWYFGSNAALNFSTNPPVDLGNSAMVALEGCASMSDASGNLLMYTNGENVYNKNHQLMANGNTLGGHASSTQSSLIVKKPGSAHQYYLFTTHATTVAPFAYSIIDMSLAAGLGSVTVKNVTVTTPVTEKLAATYHCNGQDVWILAHKQNTNEFCSYLLTAAGLNTAAVVSSAGAVHSVPQGSRGQMKISPAGNKVAAALCSPSTLDLLDFDPATGLVSNPVNLANYFGATYGCEFSPDGSKLYGTPLLQNPPTIVGIVQWDLCAGSNQAIKNTQTILDSFNIYTPNSLQLGHYNRIYISMGGLNKMGTVEAPNLPGLSCNTTTGGVTFTTGQCQIGLPNFIGSWFRQKPIASASVSACSSVAFSYTAACMGSGAAPDSIAWIFDDPASGSSDTSFLPDPGHVYPPGNKTYNARLLAYFRCYTDTIAVPVNINTYPVLTVPSLTTICKNESVTITAGGAATYSWSTGAQTPTVFLSPSTTTVYTLSGSSPDGCTSSESFTIAVDPCTGITEKQQLRIKVFPNPVKNQLIIQSNVEGIVTLTDLYGRTLGDIKVTAGENNITVSSLEDGLYLMHFKTEGISRAVFRIIKQ